MWKKIQRRKIQNFCWKHDKQIIENENKTFVYTLMNNKNRIDIFKTRVYGIKNDEISKWIM